MQTQKIDFEPFRPQSERVLIIKDAYPEQLTKKVNQFIATNTIKLKGLSLAINDGGEIAIGLTYIDLGLQNTLIAEGRIE